MAPSTSWLQGKRSESGQWRMEVAGSGIWINNQPPACYLSSYSILLVLLAVKYENSMYDKEWCDWDMDTYNSSFFPHSILIWSGWQTQKPILTAEAKKEKVWPSSDTIKNKMYTFQKCENWHLKRTQPWSSSSLVSSCPSLEFSRHFFYLGHKEHWTCKAQLGLCRRASTRFGPVPCWPYFTFWSMLIG